MLKSWVTSAAPVFTHKETLAEYFRTKEIGNKKYV